MTSQLEISEAKNSRITGSIHLLKPFPVQHISALISGQHIELLEQKKPQPPQTARAAINVLGTVHRVLHMLQDPAQAAKPRVAFHVRALEGVHVVVGTPKVLVKDVERLVASVAVVYGTDPLARIAVEIPTISVAHTVLCPVEMADVFCDREVSMLGEFEDELVEESSVRSAFASFPVDYEGREAGEG
jgi:hypothetical protein